jgi:hypothetical protein
MSRQKSPVSIVIVTYQSREVIGACLERALDAAEEVIVVDNHSQDGTIEEVKRFAGVRLLANPDNRGFAGAVNQGVAASSQPFILLLNPDAVLRSGVDGLVAAASRPGAAAAGGQLCDGNGEFQLGFAVRRLPSAWSLAFECLGLNRVLPWNPVNRRFRQLDFDPTRPQQVEQPPGAFFLFRRDVFAALGGFDERFHPLWFEDVDFCKRLKMKGLAIWYEPAAKALHAGGHSVRKLSWDRRAEYWYASLLEYSAKHFTRPEVIFVAAAVAGGAVIRSAMGIVAVRNLKPVAIYGKVIRLACRYLSRPVAEAAEAVLEEHS